jgi:hypothetical protein
MIWISSCDGPFGPGFPLRRGRVEQPVLSLHARVVEAQERRWLEDYRDPSNTSLTEEERPETKEKAIERGEIRRPMATPAHD